ncbi:MAG: hypothetical protein ACHQUC_10735 [Chlamydiales bacterium]
MLPKIYFTTEHGIDPALIDRDALYVLEKLRQAGFVAYLVGGSVRDLLIKRRPKDFDISTSARPEQVKVVFQRQCILIGRRFRLAHIRFGHKIIEVATFRAGENDSDLITQNNVWGTAEQDVMRRDFTINGLFYDSSNHSIIDYVDGWEDVQKNLLRTIGDPKVRFKQDPVRLIRLLKFQARSNFKIDPEAIPLELSMQINHLQYESCLGEEQIVLEVKNKTSLFGPLFQLLMDLITCGKSDYVPISIRQWSAISSRRHIHTLSN